MQLVFVRKRRSIDLHHHISGVCILLTTWETMQVGDVWSKIRRGIVILSRKRGCHRMTELEIEELLVEGVGVQWKCGRVKSEKSSQGGSDLQGGAIQYLPVGESKRA